MKIDALLEKVKRMTPEQKRKAAEGLQARYIKRETEFKKRRERYEPTDEFLSRSYDI